MSDLIRKSMGMGTLYISEARVSWVGIQGKVTQEIVFSF